MAAGQTIQVSGSGGAIWFIGTAAYGAQGGSGTVRYTDGSTSSYTLSFGDWWDSAPIPGNAVAVTTPYHHKAPTSYNNPATGRDEQDVTLFRTSIPLTAGKTVESITLPSGSELADAGLHIFAMTVAA